MMRATDTDVDVVLDDFTIYRSGARMTLRHTACGRGHSVPGQLSLRELIDVALQHMRSCRGAS